MSVLETKPTVSIVIPAYNQPEYLRRSLQSIVEQEYRPIEVIVSDDCSPTPLEPIVSEFRNCEDNQFKIKFFRHSTNQGVMGNFTFAVDQSTGRYVLPFAHDNWFTDNAFIGDAVTLMKTHRECLLCISDGQVENTGERMLSLTQDVCGSGEWSVMTGSEFSCKWLRSPKEGGINWTQLVLLDNRVAQDLGAFKEPYQIGPHLSNKLKIPQDNVSAYVSILSMLGSVAIYNKVVCTIGRPKTSYSQSREWRQARDKTKFVIHFNVSKSDIKGQYAERVRGQVRKTAIAYVLKGRVTPDLRILRYYNYNLEVACFMILSLVFRPKVVLEAYWRRILKPIRRNLGRIWLAFSLLLNGNWSLLLGKIRRFRNF